MDEATQLKAQLKRLGDQRAQLEAQIAVRSGRLQAAGVGMDAPLVDSEVSGGGGRRAAARTGASLPATR